MHESINAQAETGENPKYWHNIHQCIKSRQFNAYCDFVNIVTIDIAGMIMIFIAGVEMGAKAQEVGQGVGVSVVLGSAGMVAFIEGHPVLISAIGMLIGLVIQSLSVYSSCVARRRRREAQAAAKILEQLEAARDRGEGIDSAINAIKHKDRL